MLQVFNECDLAFPAKAVGDGYVKPEIKQVVKVEWVFFFSSLKFLFDKVKNNQIHDYHQHF